MTTARIVAGFVVAACSIGATDWPEWRGKGRRGVWEEDGILQSFPKSYRFVPPGAPIYCKTIGRLIGNAVPVKLGEGIGKSLIAHLEEYAGSRRNAA